MISKEEIFSIENSSDFENVALKVFRFQAKNNLTYKKFIEHLNVNPENVDSIEKIPFLPIQFFKTHKIITAGQEVEKIFTSSGTTGSLTSKHLVSDLSFYTESLIHSFKYFYGDWIGYLLFSWLRSYLEGEGSRLIDMVEFWIESSGKGGFYLYNHEALFEELK